jgi:hypothetical protein
MTTKLPLQRTSIAFAGLKDRKKSKMRKRTQEVIKNKASPLEKETRHSKESTPKTQEGTQET